MKCSSCGNTLAPGNSYCLVCGAFTAVPTTPAESAPTSQRGAGELSQPESIHSSAPPLRAQTAFYGRYGTRGNVMLPAPSSLAVPTSLTQTDETKATSTPPPTSDAPAEIMAPKANTVPMPALPTSEPTSAIINTQANTLVPRSRRPLAGRLIALGGMLVVMVLLVGLSAFGYRAYTKGQAEARATATVDARLQATSTAGAQATATARAPLLIDSLTSNTNGWITDGKTSFFANDQYHLHNPDPTMTLNAYYQQQIFDNFQVQITITAYSDVNPNADVPYAYGLVLRADPSTPANKYVFFVSPAGTYNFARHDADGFFNNGWSDLTATPWASSSAIHTGKGAVNTLKVIARDSVFTLFINGQLIETVTDTFGAFSSGWIGLMVEGADMEAGFSNLQVYGPDA